MREANGVLGSYEATPARVFHVTTTRQQLVILNLRQSELFEEALGAIEASLNRPAIVMAWAGFMDFIEEGLNQDALAGVHNARPDWRKYILLGDLRDNVTEYALLEVARSLRLLTKSELKALHGLLAKRNECAHPSGYQPNVNEALGYVSELLNRIPTIAARL